MTVYTLASSSAGNCTLVSSGSTHILIDAGISLRRIRDRLRQIGLSPDNIDCVLVTHEHIDHISGIRMLVKYHKTPIFSSLGERFGICRTAPEAEPYINCFETGASFDIGGIIVSSFRTPHDTNGSVGYTLTAGGIKLAYATDLGCLTEEVLEATSGADIAIIESNHDRDMLRRGPYPPYLKRRILSEHGHLANNDSGLFAAKLVRSGTRYIQLAHLSCENNTPDLAGETVAQTLVEYGIMAGTDVELDIAPPYTPGRMYML